MSDDAKRDEADTPDADPTPSVKGAFVMTWEDWRALQTAYMQLTRYRRYGVLILWVLIAIMAAYGVFMVTAFGAVLGWIMIAYAGVLVICKFAIGPWSQKRAYQRSGLADADVSLSVGPQGVNYATPQSNSELSWAMIRRFSRAKNCSFLWLNSRQAFIVPDRAFVYAGQLNDFCALAEEHVTEQPL